MYRLTLVKAWNAEEIESYAGLVSLGNPDFIEIKGVTYCGTSKTATLTMDNVPWHEEVLGFVQKLADKLDDYEIACEHEHSNCVLLAHRKVRNTSEHSPHSIHLLRSVRHTPKIIGSISFVSVTT